MDSTAGSAAAVLGQSEGFVIGSTLTLDEDLRKRLTAVAAEEQDGAERFGSSKPILVEAATWLALGAAIWMLTILVWG